MVVDFLPLFSHFTKLIQKLHYCSLVHKAEESGQVDFVVLTLADNLIHAGLQVFENLQVWDLSLLCRRSVKFPGVLLHEFWHVKQSLKIPQSVICFTLIDSSIEFTLASSIDTSLID